jgi:hypothetical protein
MWHPGLFWWLVDKVVAYPTVNGLKLAAAGTILRL